MKVNKQHIELIKMHIDEKLRQRSIFVETKLELGKNRGGGPVLELTSTKFNTVPVIHSEMELDNFGGSVLEGKREFENGESTKNIRVSVPVHVSYEGNGVKLFNVNCEIQERCEDTVFFTGEKDQLSVYDLEK